LTGTRGFRPKARPTERNITMTWAIDPFHTQIEFATKHLGMMTVRGHFTEVQATGTIDPDNPENSSVTVTIQAPSLRTNNAMRDDDLRSPNFLDTEQFPTITFTSTSIQQTGPDTFTMTGDLTIKGITHPATLKVLRYGEMNDPGMMGHRIAYSAETEIDRRDFGLTFNALLDGRWAVGDQVAINIELELVEQQQEQDAASTSA
jgi:polyisoprenoid-binding protein YceI